jgi:hypothetical protein
VDRGRNTGLPSNRRDAAHAIFFAPKAEPLYFADRVSEALEAITEAEEAVERSEEHWWCAELHRLRGVFMTAMGADDAQIEASFRSHQNRKGARRSHRHISGASGKPKCELPAENKFRVSFVGDGGVGWCFDSLIGTGVDPRVRV